MELGKTKRVHIVGIGWRRNERHSRTAAEVGVWGFGLRFFPQAKLPKSLRRMVLPFIWGIRHPRLRRVMLWSTLLR